MTARRLAYERARARHRCLEPFATPADVLAAVGPASRLTMGEKDDVVAALITENQESPSPALQSLLLLVFEGMLKRLGAALRFEKGGDRDDDVVFAFLDALRTVSAGDHHTFLAVRWGTMARLDGVRRVHRVEPHEDDIEPDVSSLQAPGVRADVKLEVDEILDALEDAGGRELVDATIAADAFDEPLSDFVARVHANERPAVRARIYERLVRSHAAALVRLRARLARRLAAAA